MPQLFRPETYKCIQQHYKMNLCPSKSHIYFLKYFWQANEESRRNQLMRDMAQLRLQVGSNPHNTIVEDLPQIDLSPNSGHVAPHVDFLTSFHCDVTSQFCKYLTAHFIGTS